MWSENTAPKPNSAGQDGSLLALALFIGIDMAEGFSGLTAPHLLPWKRGTVGQNTGRNDRP
jgi:hypothetical protein